MLAQLPLQAYEGNPLDSKVASCLPYALHNAYGDATIPYPDTLLDRPEYSWVHNNCARELILVSRAEGFAFVAPAIANNRLYRREIIEFVRDRFPQLRKADDSVILKFVQYRTAMR
jgi:hypothetical protein